MRSLVTILILIGLFRSPATLAKTLGQMPWLSGSIDRRIVIDTQAAPDSTSFQKVGVTPLHDGLYTGWIAKASSSNPGCGFNQTYVLEIFVSEQTGYLIVDKKSHGSIMQGRTDPQTGQLELLGGGLHRLSLSVVGDHLTGIFREDVQGRCVHDVTLDRLPNIPLTMPKSANVRENGLYEAANKPVCNASEENRVSDYYLHIVNGIAGTRIRGRGVFGFIEPDSSSILYGYNLKVLLTKTSFGYHMTIEDAGRESAPNTGAGAYPACHIELDWTKKFAY